MTHDDGHDTPTPAELCGLPRSSYARGHAMDVDSPTDCPKCGEPRTVRQQGGRQRALCIPCDVARNRQRREQATPLLEAVRAFLAAGVPMDTGGVAIGCAYCGFLLDVLRDHGHSEYCAWARLKARVAGE